jgi:hypothetical protein
MHILPADPSNIIIHLLGALGVLNRDFLLLNDQVGLGKRPADFAAVGAMTQVPARSSKQLGVVDGHFDGATEASAFEFVWESIVGVGVGVACEV